MEAIQQVDNRRLPWVSYADGRVALVASTLPGAHDEGHRISVDLLRRFEKQILDITARTAAISNSNLIDIIHNAFSAPSGLESWGLHFGVAVAAEEHWRVWTAGLVYCARWSPGTWMLVTEPQSVTRQLREQGTPNTSDSLADDMAAKIACLSTTPEDIEHAVVPMEPMTGVILLGSVKAGQLIESATYDPSWHLTSANHILDTAIPLAAGSPLATFAALIS